ncbi:hypothetical protein VP01_1214g4 [Puccinia sorghi]|uniref:Uncharacterized protein n=1 Tax=Puccinia sorghi TaxID=27349 RepID=A0A0L6VQD4_9BASI|nr:hypothetical protein VP01_1214g4 [Puccinia sorghi]
MNSKPFKGLNSKPFLTGRALSSSNKNSFSLKSLLKALPARKVVPGNNGSIKSEPFSTLDFSACVSCFMSTQKFNLLNEVIENQAEVQVSDKLRRPRSEYHGAEPQSVTLMTFSKVVDISEELGPRATHELAKQRTRSRRNTFMNLKIKKSSSRPNTAIEAIISDRRLESVVESAAPEGLRARHSEHLRKSRDQLFLKKETPKACLLKNITPTAREVRLKYRRYTPPLDSFELQRSLQRQRCNEGIFCPRLDPSSYARIMHQEEHRRRIENLAYRTNPFLLPDDNTINNGVRSLKLETIPESVGVWSISKDPRDPRQRRNKLEYLVTSW